MPNTPAAVMYLRENAEISVMEFIGERNHFATSILAPTLLAFHTDAERRNAFERLDAQVMESWQRRLNGENETLRKAAEKRLKRIASGESKGNLQSYERHRKFIESCVFTTRPLYAILAPWAKYLDAQVERARMNLLLAEASDVSADSEPNSIRALRLFAQRGVALDPSRTFESEIVITYDELFAAFGGDEGSVEGEL
ncbi:hypothetical protein AAG589_00725 [Isoptericola sp. F-RaC21]|uniref:hypothetical protein n=1 Tax=Isoptericola sp. F-RaC21 TaxID=3141452 RepID=UPI00315B7E85